jgi:hypothetical protein
VATRPNDRGEDRADVEPVTIYGDPVVVCDVVALSKELHWSEFIALGDFSQYVTFNLVRT